MVMQDFRKDIRVEPRPHLSDNDAVDGGRGLVGAVGPPKLLDGFVGRPGQLQRQVAAPALVGNPAEATQNISDAVCMLEMPVSLEAI